MAKSFGTNKEGELVMDFVIRYHNGTRYIVYLLYFIEQLNRNLDLIDLSSQERFQRITAIRDGVPV